MNFRFSNLLGAPFRGGNAIFHGKSTLFSPVGNRVSILDLQASESITLPFECSYNVYRIAISPNGVLLIVVDAAGRALFVNSQRRIVLHRFSFKSKVRVLKFSPDGRYFAAGVGRLLQVWKTPSLEKTFTPFELHRTYTPFHGDVTCIDWSHDGLWIMAGAKDLTVKIFSFNPLKEYKPVTFSGNRETIMGVYFLQLDEMDVSDRPYTRSVYTVSKDGFALEWNFFPDNVLQQILKFNNGEKRKRGESESEEDEDEGNGNVDDNEMEKEESKDLDGGNEKEEDGKDVEMEMKQGDEDEDEIKIIIEDDTKSTDKINGEMDNETTNTEDTQKQKKEKEEMKVEERMDAGKWRLVHKHNFKQNGAKLKSVDFHHGLKLMVATFTNGIFCLYQMPSFTAIQTLSVSSQSLTSVCFNSSGEWIAMASSKLGQLLVWEWRSETYVIKQQGHYYDVNCLSFSSDASLMATGADDNKLKLWNVASGLCFVTMSDHTQPITSVQFVTSNATVVTCSLDGTVRVYDLLRYRNFRTFVSPTPTQLSSLAVHPSGDIVCASSLDTFQIFVWSMKTGSLLDVLKGHEGPISSLSFSPASETLASASWDKTVKLWDIFQSKGSTESFLHNHDVMTMTFRPDGRQLASATLDGHLYFWDTLTHELEGTIDGKRDIAGGRLFTDRRTAKNSPLGKNIRTICYSPDGAFLLAAGNSKYMCCYDSRERVLLKRFQLSFNMSLDGILDQLSSKRMTEAGPLDLLPTAGSDDEDQNGRDDLGMQLPGTNPLLSNYKRPPIQAKSVCIASTGEVWAIASTEGVLIYTMDDALIFDPEELGEDATPQTIENAIKEKKYAVAVNLALRLNEPVYLHNAIEQVPFDQIPIIISSIPKSRLPPLLSSIATHILKSPHLEFLLIWCKEICSIHGRFIQGRGKKQMIVPLRILQKSLTQLHDDLAKSCSSNLYLLRYLTSAPTKALEDSDDEALEYS